ncbi:MAG TPA: right-handed parallel beta-helix repeat-containing protein [Acidimicrobiia bacterium]|nr:right-handed parallel beta-helix repeat-containing protein [Acidimicrobiia bacterium]
MRTGARLRGALSAPVAAMLLVGGGIAAGVIAGSATSAGATTVSTEAQLRAAFDTGSSITLANDINLSDCGSGDVTRSIGNAGVGLALDGGGHTIRQTCNGSRVLFNGTTDPITLQNVTITGGNVNDGDGGGGIHSDVGAPLTVINSAIINNLTCEQGGGIEMDRPGNLTVINSTIANNTAVDSDGGGIAIVGGSSSLKTVVTNSTVTGNKSVEAGGIEVDAGSLKLTYATVVDNTVDPTLTCPPSLQALKATSATHHPHHADPVEPRGTKGGVTPAAGPVTFPANIRVVDTSANQVLTSFGSVVALPHGGPDCGTFPTGPPPLVNTVSNGFNYSDQTTCGFTAGTDKQNAADPNLAALAANGGLAPTRLPNPGSPLIDAIPLGSCSADGAATINPLTDERGVSRPQGAGCEIGAVEVVVPLIVTPRFTG